jgi:hypothetical protein
MFSATAGALSQKHLALLGKLLLKTEPETAHRLLSTYLPQEQPAFSDLSRIPDLFLLFCQVNNLNVEEYKGALCKTSKMNWRKEFIAVILHFYCPQVYRQPLDQIILNQGLLKGICDAVRYSSKGSMHKFVREVVLWERNYEDFRASIASNIQKMNHAFE